MWNGRPFSGTKIALLCGDLTVAYLRDEKPDIPFPGLWDLPGGGREGDETPIACGLREVAEEFGLALSPSDILLIERHESKSGGLDTYFCAMRIDQADIDNIRFGDEGQRWMLMPIRDFVAHNKAVPHLQRRLQAVVEMDLLN
jgi:8-oxo-dGTP diphosphatase